MKKCPECNNMNDDKEERCSNCGYSFSDNDEKMNGQPDEKSEGDNKKVGKENGKETDYEENADSSVGTKNSGTDSIAPDAPMNQEDSGKIDLNSSDTAVPEAVPDNSGESDLSKNSIAVEGEKTKKEKKNISKRTIGEVICGVALVMMIILVIIKSNELNSVQKQYDEISKQLDSANEEISQLTDKNDALFQANKDLSVKNNELENGAAKQLVDIKNAYEDGDWETVISLADTLHQAYNGSEEDKEAQKLSSQSQAKIDEANEAKAKEEAKGYETGITYDQLARTPDDYEGKKVKFYGKVIQVLESDGTVTIRLAVNDDYDTILYGQYNSDIVSSRVLEDDHITVYGTSVGTISYESTMGGTITIPGVFIQKIDQ